MDNHVHLMIKTDTESLGKLMGRISASYTRYFNKKYNYIGHLFQDRYFGELIESDKQMLEASRYIHLNPVKANMVEKPGEYEWSSYNMIIGNKKEKIIKKSGSHFDLAMAIGLLIQSKQLTFEDSESFGFIGELSLNADIRACSGILPMAIEAKNRGITNLIVPRENIREASLVKGINILGLKILRKLFLF